MALFDFLRRLVSGSGEGHGVDELARRLGMGAAEIAALKPRYREFALPKASGGTRRITAPDDDTRRVQRTILRRLLARLPVHAAATGFEPGKSIVDNARPHAGRAVVIRMDVRDFFGTTRAKRISQYFRAIGWNRDTAELLTRLTTYGGALPQGAPTSPRLSNLVNYHLDARLSGLARRFGAAYTRYADDLTFSLERDDRESVHALVRIAKHVVEDEGYRLHMRRKLSIKRRHRRQIVTGLVVNARPRLPRETRRWLRAAEHHAATGRPVTLSERQLAGWRSFAAMVDGSGPKVGW